MKQTFTLIFVFALIISIAFGVIYVTHLMRETKIESTLICDCRQDATKSCCNRGK